MLNRLHGGDDLLQGFQDFLALLLLLPGDFLLPSESQFHFLQECFHPLQVFQYLFRYGGGFIRALSGPGEQVSQCRKPGDQRAGNGFPRAGDNIIVVDFDMEMDLVTGYQVERTQLPYVCNPLAPPGRQQLGDAVSVDPVVPGKVIGMVNFEGNLCVTEAEVIGHIKVDGYHHGFVQIHYHLRQYDRKDGRVIRQGGEGIMDGIDIGHIPCVYHRNGHIGGLLKREAARN